MGLFSSDDKIPISQDTPSFPSLSQLQEETPTPELPSIPKKNSSESLNEAMVKSAIDDDANNYYENFEEQRQETSSSPKPTPGTIYVKIDKFKNAQKSLDNIQKKVKEMTKLIEELKESKAKELAEINKWDEEMKKMNTRLSRIDSGIFGEV